METCTVSEALFEYSSHMLVRRGTQCVHMRMCMCVHVCVYIYNVYIIYVLNNSHTTVPNEYSTQSFIFYFSRIYCCSETINGNWRKMSLSFLTVVLYSLQYIKVVMVMDMVPQLNDVLNHLILIYMSDSNSFLKRFLSLDLLGNFSVEIKCKQNILLAVLDLNS